MVFDFKDYEVEFDDGRGVIYIHSKKNGRTIVRICGLTNSIVSSIDNGLDSVDISLVNDFVLMSKDYKEIK